MKRIAFIGTGFHPVPPVKGAAVETWIYEVGKRLSDRYDIHILSPAHPFLPLYGKDEGVVCHRVKMGRIYTRIFKKILSVDPFSYEKRLSLIIESIKPDILHIHNKFNILSFIKTENGLKTVLHLHNGDPIGLKIPVNAYIGCCLYTLNLWKHVMLSLTDRFHVLYNGVDTKRFKPWWQQREKRNRFRERFGIASSKNILTVCRVSPEKGIEYLIEAFKLILKKHKNVRLIIAGEIRKGQRKNCDREEYGRKILSMIEEIKDYVILTDLIPPDEIHNYYLLGDIFVLTSKRENFPFVVLEAMASGLPVVSSDVGGIGEVVACRKNGFLVYPEDIHLLYEKLDSILQDQRLRKELGMSGRDIIQKKFSWEKIACDTHTFYESLY